MNEYIKAVEKKLKKQGFSDEEIVVKIKNIINPKVMEEEIIKDEVVVDEVNIPVEEEEVIEEAPEEVVDEEEEVV